MPRPHLVSMFVLLLAMSSTVSLADSVVLKNGGTLRGKIVKETDNAVTIQVTNLGKMTVERSRIKEIVRTGAASRTASRPRRPTVGVPAFPTQPLPMIPKLPAPSPRGPAQGILQAYADGLGEGDAVPTKHIWKYQHELEPLGRRATGDLVHALATSRDWRVRLLAARALKTLADPASVPALIHALADPFQGGIVTAGLDPTMQSGYKIRDEATRALKPIGQPAHAALLATAADRKHPDQWAAVDGLRRLDVPRRVPVLVRLARDFAQSKEVRNTAVAGLVKQGNGAQQALARLLADKVVQKEVSTALKRSKDPAAIDVLMSFVKKAESDTDLARRAADAIWWINKDYRPRFVNDSVDLLLFFSKKELIRKEFGNRALPRLKFWLSARSSEMKSAAHKARAHYGNIRVGGGTRKRPPSPVSRPPSTGSS
jgi:PAS domain-containing protein